MTSYENVDPVFGYFKDNFEEDDLIFTQKYIAEHQQISIYALKDKQKVDVVACLDFLNGLQEKFTYHYCDTILMIIMVQESIAFSVKMTTKKACMKIFVTLLFPSSKKWHFKKNTT